MSDRVRVRRDGLVHHATRFSAHFDHRTIPHCYPLKAQSLGYDELTEEPANCLCCVTDPTGDNWRDW